jgi:TolB protein
MAAGQHAVSPFPAARAAWSPDGRQLLYQSHRGTGGIFLLNLETGAEVRLTSPEVECFDPAWSPDGKWVVHARGGHGSRQLFVMDPQGGSVRQLTQLYSMSATVPAWSPDGGRIAFTGKHNRETGVFVMRPDGTEVSRLTEGFASAAEASWSRDRAHIYFESDRFGQ